MRRREFIAGLGAVAVALWPVVVRAQQRAMPMGQISASYLSQKLGVHMRPFLAALLTSTAVPALAADIQIKGNQVFILGTIEAGDDAKFGAKVEPHTGHMVVVLHSAGGLLIPAYAIGRAIRERGWDTHAEYTCNSACSLIWLAGVKHSKTEGALIGFHGAADIRTRLISQEANAWSAGYLAGLGYSHDVGTYGTASRSLTYLTPKDARRLGVQMTIVPHTIPWQTFAGVDLNKKPKVANTVSREPMPHAPPQDWTKQTQPSFRWDHLPQVDRVPPTYDPDNPDLIRETISH